MMADVTLTEWLQGLCLPAILYSIAVVSFFQVLFETLIRRNRSLSAVKDEAFARFWNKISGPPPDPNAPLMGSAALIPPLLATAEGVVLEVGPGSGVQVQYFKAASSNIRKIYGAEPCIPLHPALLANAQKHGLENKYSIITAGGEKETLIPKLAEAGLLAKAADRGGLFDTIVCIRVLCSVHDLKDTGETLYKLLKPGGRLLVCEHTKNPWRTRKGSLIARALQSMFELLGWTFFVGNCHLTRDIRRGLIEAAKPYGGWAEVDLSNHFSFMPLPYVSGMLKKRH